MRLSGSNLAYFTKNITFTGFNQKVKVDTGGDVKTSYVILDSDNSGSKLYQTYLVDLTAGKLSFAGRSIQFPGGYPPPSDSSCWFDKDAVCTGGKRLRFRMNIGEHRGVWMQVLTVIWHVLHTFPLNIKLPVVIFRCGGYLHHSGVRRHLHSGDSRARYKSLYQVQFSFKSNKCNLVFLYCTLLCLFHDAGNKEDAFTHSMVWCAQ